MGKEVLTGTGYSKTMKNKPWKEEGMAEVKNSAGAIKLLLNGEPIFADSPLGAMSEVFRYIPNLDLWSYEALSDLYVGTVDLIVEWCREMKKTTNKTQKYTKFINQSKTMLMYIPKDRDAFVKKVYEIILASDGLSTLPGFGMTNQFGDTIYGDPEKQSLNSTRTLT
jgi:hypothetical protein